MNSPMVHVIVLNWNGSDDTKTCVDSLKHLNYPNFLIKVLDNGSSDNSSDVLSNLDGISFERIKNNIGYAGGNNKCMLQSFSSGADYVWLLNNDTVVPPDCLRTLVALGEENAEAGLLSPVLKNNNSSRDVQFYCGQINLNNGIYDFSSNDLEKAKSLIAQSNVGGHVLFLKGTALLVKRSLFDKIGPLDEGLFAYQEDNDYCIRSHRAGFQNVLVTDTFVLHTPLTFHHRVKKPYYHYLMYRNNIIVSRRYLSIKVFAKVVWWLYVGLREQVKSLDQDSINAILAGFWDGLLGHKGPFDPGRQMPSLIRRLFFNFA